ncbi:MAG: hypothetical protein QXX08_09860, partial [Candidatus Bathyarchaeia archaeon]
MKAERLLLSLLVLALLSIVIFNAKATNSSENSTNVSVGVWLVNVEKVDLAASSYRLDFYMWFRFNSS